MYRKQQNQPVPRPLWFAAAFVLPLILLYTLFNATTQPALGRAPDAGGIIVHPTEGLVTTEAGGIVTFTVVLTSHPNGPVQIPMVSSDTTEGIVEPSILTILPSNWDEAHIVTVTGVDDSVEDGIVPYTIFTGEANSNDDDYDGLNPADVSVANADDELGGILVEPISGLMTSEGGLTDTFTIVLTTEPTATVTIPLSSSDSGEGTVSPSSVTFTPADWDDPQTVTVTGVNDDVDDGDQPYNAVTGPAVSDDPLYNGLNAPDVAVTNQDDDTAAILVDPTSGLITSEDGAQDTFTIVLATQPTAEVTIPLNSSDPGEGTVPPSVTFDATNWDDPQIVTVTGVDDALADGDQPYTIVTGAASSGDPAYDGLNPADVTATNLDNDAAAIQVQPTSGLITSEDGGQDTFTVVLLTQPTADVSIPLSSSDPGEGTVSPPSLTFTPSNWDDPQTATVTGVNDDVDDGDQPYTIVTGPAASTDPAYDDLNPADVAVTNQDNDTAAILIDPVAGLITGENGREDTFTVVLATQPTANVTIAFTSSDLTEGTVDPPSVTFTPADWDDPRTVTVTGVDDALDDGDQPYTIVTGAASSSDPNYSGLNPPDVSVTNLDNDGAGISIDPLTDKVTTEAGGTDTFTVRLDTQPTADVTIAFTSSDLTEGTVDPDSLTFTSDNWDTPHTVTITGVDDLVADGDILYTIITAPAVSSDPAYDGMNPADVSVINQDNDTAAITVNPVTGLVTSEAGDSDTFTVRLNSQPTANVVILLTSSDPSEGTVEPNSLTFTPQNWDDFQQVTVTGVDDDLDDGDIPYTIVTAPATTTDPSYSGMNAADVQVVNLDRDNRLYLPSIAIIPMPPLAWQRVGDEPAGVTRFYTVAVCDDTTFAGADSGLYRLVGNTWQQQTDDGFPAITVSGMAFTPNCNTLFVGTRGQGTWRGDQTAGVWNWQRVDTPSPAADNNVWAVVLRGETLFVGTEGGLFWETMPAFPQTFNQTNLTDWVTGLTLNEDNSIYAAIWTVGVYEVLPGSYTFKPVGSLGDGLVYQAALTANNYRTAGTQSQLYRWSGNNWQAVNQFVSTTFAVIGRNGRLYAGQRNNGILVSENGGVTWATMNNGMAMPAGEEFQARGFFIDSDGYLYAATTSGVWRWSIPLD